MRVVAAIGSRSTKAEASPAVLGARRDYGRDPQLDHDKIERNLRRDRLFGDDSETFHHFDT
jgi:hypothetical protein